MATVKHSLEAVPGVQSVQIDLENASGTLSITEQVPLIKLQDALAKSGHYTISNPEELVHESHEETKSFLATYKPLFLIVAFVAGVGVMVQFPFETWSSTLWMQHFMAGFFIVFSFFKLLNIKGFADSYAMYDVIAGKFKAWGYIYPFVELLLGVAYLISWNLIVTNITTVIVLGISSIGVIRSNLNKEKIKCACLGDVFNLPMSTVTVIEDLTMVAMALIMLI